MHYRNSLLAALLCLAALLTLGLGTNRAEQPRSSGHADVDKECGEDPAHDFERRFRNSIKTWRFKGLSRDSYESCFGGSLAVEVKKRGGNKKVPLDVTAMMRACAYGKTQVDKDARSLAYAEIKNYLANAQERKKRTAYLKCYDRIINPQGTKKQAVKKPARFCCKCYLLQHTTWDYPHYLLPFRATGYARKTACENKCKAVRNARNLTANPKWAYSTVSPLPMDHCP